jgi:hypothetical protein
VAPARLTNGWCWVSLPGMVFGRKRRPSRDPFKQMVTERRATEDERPWFLEADEGEALEVDTGRSARMGEGTTGAEDLDGPTT